MPPKPRPLSRPPWLFCSHPVANATRTIVACPFAGGGQHVFAELAAELAADRVEVWTVCYPARGGRRAEPPIADLIADVVEPLETAVREPARERLFILGYSMGGIVASELASRLGSTVSGLVVCAKSPPPSTTSALGGVEDMSDADFAALLRRMGGTPDEFFDDPELVAFFLPTVRGDFVSSARYMRATGAKPALAVPVLAVGAAADEYAPANGMDAWTNGHADDRALTLPGGHFDMLMDKATCQLLAAELRSFVAKTEQK